LGSFTGWLLDLDLDHALDLEFAVESGHDDAEAALITEGREKAYGFTEDVLSGEGPSGDKFTSRRPFDMDLFKVA